MAVSFDAILRIGAKVSGAAEVKQLTAAMGGLEKAGATARNVLGGIAAAAGFAGLAAIGQSIAKAGIESQRTDVRIKALAGSFGEVEGVAAIAAKAADQFAMSNVDARNAVADLYGRLRPMGVTLKDVETVFFGVNKAALQAGLGMEDVNDVMLQLSQALGSGRLQGDELRSIMERMPAVGQAVAKVMGVTVGQIKELGSQGKITTDVMIRAAAELNKIQPPPPTPFQRFQATMGNLSSELGAALLPALTKVTVAATTFAQQIGNYLERNREQITLFFNALLETSKVLFPLAKNIFAVVAGYQALRGVIMLATAATKAFALVSALTPQGLAMLAASATLGLAVFGKIEAKMREITNEAKANTTETAATTSVVQQLQAAWQSVSFEVNAAGEAQAAATAEAKAAAEAAKERAAYEKIIADNIERLVGDMQAINDRMGAATDLYTKRRELANEVLNAEQSWLNVAKQQLQNRLSVTTNEQDRLALTQQLAALEAKAAEAQYQASINQIAIEREQLAIKTLQVENDFRAAVAAQNYARSMGAMTQQIADNANRARQALMAQARVDLFTNRILDARTSGAQATRQAAQLAATGGQVTQPETPRSFVTVAGMRIPQFAKGGYVNRPTLAMIGEGGEGEYVVPESQVGGFARRVMAGQRGSNTIRPLGRSDELRSRLAAAQQRGEFRNLSTEGERVKRGQIARSLGFIPGAGSMPFTLRPGASSSGGARGGGSVSVSVNTRVDRVIRQDGEDRVTLGQAQQMASDAARQAVAQMTQKLRQPSYRREVGIR